MKLLGKVAVVSGGSSGIGRATALLFAEEGAQVVILARGEVRGHKTVEAIQSQGGKAVFIPCDVGNAQDVCKAVELIVEKFGRLDILFCNAGVIFPDRTVITTSEDEWEQTMATNAKGVYLLCKYAIPWMIRGGGGAIVNTASVWGLRGAHGAAAYCAAKGAVVTLTKAMALDHAQNNIRVNCICPGSVETEMLRGEMEALGGIEKVRPTFAARHPLGRIAAPHELANAVLYLASDDSSFVTGVCLPVDGGRAAADYGAAQISTSASEAPGQCGDS